MRKFIYLSSCDTCKRIQKELNLPDSVVLQDIKEAPLTTLQLDELKALCGSYESLFSKRARLYQERNLKEQNLEESDFRNLILEHYTFLKRPVLVWDDHIFVGNGKKVVQLAVKTVNDA